MQSGSADLHKRKAGVAALSILSNATLVVLKLLVGLLIGSVSVLSEAIHSAVDLVASVIAFLSVRTSAKPADVRHPFGHGKYENLSGAIEALLIFLAAIWIIFEAVHKLIAPQPLEKAGIGVIVMSVSAITNWLISRRLFRIGRETDSIALQADAWHLRTDVYTSLGVMAGLGIIWSGYWVVPTWNLNWVDPVAALCVAILILKAAWDLTAESVKDLLDARLPDEEEAWIINYIRELRPLVQGVHDLRTRKGGAMRFVEFHLIVPESMTVAEAHAISDKIEEAITARYPATHVTTHIEPCRQPCPETCLPGCFLTEEERKGV
ncbi:MAG: cation diffusion facilitator family transporter [bacterium]|jgi:cation diffusion facilitator family transporter